MLPFKKANCTEYGGGSAVEGQASAVAALALITVPGGPEAGLLLKTSVVASAVIAPSTARQHPTTAEARANTPRRPHISAHRNLARGGAHGAEARPAPTSPRRIIVPGVGLRAPEGRTPQSLGIGIEPTGSPTQRFDIREAGSTTNIRAIARLPVVSLSSCPRGWRASRSADARGQQVLVPGSGSAVAAFMGRRKGGGVR